MARRHLDNGWLGQYVSGAKRSMEKSAVKLAVANASRNKVSDLTNKEIKAKERNIASAYFSQTPTISNLYNGAKHWVNSVFTPNNDVKPVNYNTGDVPTPNLPAKFTKALKIARTFDNKTWDDLYFRALRTGDINEAQRLRDLHFVAKRVYDYSYLQQRNGKPLLLYKGGKKHGGTNNIRYRYLQNKPFVTTDKRYALNFTGDRNEYTVHAGHNYTYDESELLNKNKNKITKLYGRYRNKLETPDELNFYSVGRKFETNPGVDLVEGHDAPVFDVWGWRRSRGKEFSFRHPNDLKSADAITYNSRGKVIPLSERDNFDSFDINYGLIPILLGAGYGVYSNRDKNTYKYGGIHIDPANRGALTETMRRTGKTKYQLAHSKNPLTRMRARFAINASHWNHG